jgi:antitoxin component YwqK of YwqJK toxin-antitoxin module
MRIFLILSFFILISFISNGQEINARNKNSQREGLWRITGSDIKDSADIYCDTCTIEQGYYKSGKKTGEWRSFYGNHTIKSTIEYKNGRINGKVSSYYFTGCIKEKGTWIGTALYDTLKTYSGHPDSCGVLIKIAFYNGNKKFTKPVEGKLPDPNPDNAKKLTGDEIKSDQEVKDGYNKVYDSKRRILLDGEFKDGKIYTGQWYRYNSEGTLTKIELYKDGKYVGDAKLD